jgi:predicted MPP superfamily phosphohydrolase
LVSLLHLAVWVLVLSGILLVLHVYLWARLVRDVGLPAPWRRRATLALALLGASVLATFFVGRSAPRAVTSPLAWVAYGWIGLALLAAFFIGATDLVSLLVRATRVAAPLDTERRRALARFAAGAAGLGTLGASGAAVRGASAGAIRVQKVRVALAGLGPAFEGYRIVQLSDIHVGPTIGRGFIDEIVQRVNSLQPDLVVITGDLIDGTVEQLSDLVAPLGQLKARDGLFFTTGNHEYYWPGLERWFAFLAGLGIRVLRNERVSIGGDGGFELAGIDDISASNYDDGHGADLERALAGRDASRPVVLMAHNPRQVEDARRLGVDLQLSGHTHGGQLFPMTFLVRLYMHYVAGLYEVGRTQLYVSRGTGYWGPPMRLGAPAEISELTLASRR